MTIHIEVIYHISGQITLGFTSTPWWDQGENRARKGKRYA
jgi:hypothetical protein